MPSKRVPTPQAYDLAGNSLHYSYTDGDVKYFVPGQNHHHGGHGGPAHEQAIYRVPKPTIPVMPPAHQGNLYVHAVAQGLGAAAVPGVPINVPAPIPKKKHHRGQVQAIYRVPNPPIHVIAPAHPGGHGVERMVMYNGTLYMMG